MARAFARAARHSRRVRFLRVALPVTIVLTLGTTWFVSWLDPLKVLVRLPIDSGRLVISGTKITMEAPKLSGYTKDRRWYELTATAAAQDITKPDLVELHDVRAKVEAEDKSSTMFLAAKDGVFNRKAGILTLNNDISLRSSSGYEMKLNEAVVDTANGEVVSNKPVEVITQQATLRADRLEVVKSGEIVRFLGNVVMNLTNLDNDSAQAEKK
jgi:lipopolysaccharide export system protein LptC